MSGMQWKKGSRAPIYMTVIRQRNQNWLLKDEKEFAKLRELVALTIVIKLI